MKEIHDVKYTVHAPYQNSPVEHLRINFAEINERNTKLMEKVLEICNRIDAECVVVHGGDALNGKALSNVIENLKVICDTADKYGINVVIENVFTSEKGIKRVGETPEELLYIAEKVSKDNLGINIDVGHAFISSFIHGIQIEDYFKILGDYIVHLHVHNNHGLHGNPWDEHLPLFSGLIDYTNLRNLLKSRNVVLEVKNGSKEEIRASLDFLRVRSVRPKVNYII